VKIELLHPIRAALLVIPALSLVGCANIPLYSPPTDLAPGQAAVLSGSIQFVDGCSVHQQSFFGPADPVTLRPGPHLIGTGQGANCRVQLPLTFRPGNNYEIDFSGLSFIVTIRNTTSGQTWYFDSVTLVFFDKSRTPQPLTTQPFSP